MAAHTNNLMLQDRLPSSRVSTDAGGRGGGLFTLQYLVLSGPSLSLRLVKPQLAALPTLFPILIHVPYQTAISPIPHIYIYAVAVGMVSSSDTCSTGVSPMISWSSGL